MLDYSITLENRNLKVERYLAEERTKNRRSRERIRYRDSEIERMSGELDIVSDACDCKKMLVIQMKNILQADDERRDLRRRIREYKLKKTELEALLRNGAVSQTRLNLTILRLREVIYCFFLAVFS